MAQRILVIDDAASIRKLFKTALPAPRFEVVTPPSGEMALEQLARDGEGYVAAFVDVSLPGEDGYAIAARVRQTLQVPLVAMKHRHQAWDNGARKSLGETAVLSKPFIHDDVHRLIRQLGLEPPSAEELQQAGAQVYQQGWHV